jgi:hypothetical protein
MGKKNIRAITYTKKACVNTYTRFFLILHQWERQLSQLFLLSLSSEMIFSTRSRVISKMLAIIIFSMPIRGSPMTFFLSLSSIPFSIPRRYSVSDSRTAHIFSDESEICAVSMELNNYISVFGGLKSTDLSSSISSQRHD